MTLASLTAAALAFCGLLELLDQGGLLRGRCLGRGQLGLDRRERRIRGSDRILQRNELLRQRIGLGRGRGERLLGLLDAVGDRGRIDRKVRQPAAVLRIPDADLTGPVRGEDTRIVVS